LPSSGISKIAESRWLRFVTLVEAGLVKGRKMTSYRSMATDVKNARANWVDKAVVVDQA
jgi:protease I